MLLAVLCLCGVARGAEWKSEALNCFLRVPDEDGWRITEQPPVAGAVASVTAQDAGGVRRAALLIWKLPYRRTAIGPEFIKDFEHAFFRPPLEKLSGRTRSVQGIPAYEAVGVAQKDGQASYSLACVVLANGHAYRLDVVAAGVDVRSDEKAMRVVHGFGFIRPPQALGAQDPAVAARQRTTGVVLFLIGVIVLIFVLKLSRRRRMLGRSGKP